MNFPFIATTLFTSVLAQSALAANDSGPWIAVEGGRDFSIATTQTHVAIMPDVNLPDDYILNNTQNNWMVGIGAGYQFARPVSLFPTLSSEWLPADRLGVFYDYYSPQSVSGVINQYQLTTAYNNHFSVHSNTFWLDNQLDLVRMQSFTPFIDLGVGASFNSASGYAESPTADNDLPRQNSAAFTSNTHLAFAYRAGIGLNYRMPTTQPMDVGILYRYTNRGYAQTGNSAYYPIGSLQSGQLKSNEIALTLRYNF